MKKILGLDLGTTSIGWALVNESEGANEKSSIIKLGVRVIPLTTDESSDFKKGKAISINAERTLKRGARKNLHRYKQRRENLIELLIKKGLISADTILSEDGKETTHSLWAFRAKAATEEVNLDQFARILLSINKKRGYKSNRKIKENEEEAAIDGMDIARELYTRDITPGQYMYEQLKQDKKHMPDFYRSDLQAEFDAIWNFQKKFYPEILTGELKEKTSGKNKKQTWAICSVPFQIEGIKQKGNAREKQKELYRWRVQALSEKLDLEQLAIVLSEINSQISNSSGYLGGISDRSKELYFKNLTVGQYLYNQLRENPHASLKNQVFYRQDYMDEFEKIWEVQSKNRKNILTDTLKKEIRDIVIFYQRRLKSQKALISICELEGKEVEIEIDGKKKNKIIGPRVIPKSSPLFQEFKIWQILNNLKFRNIHTKQQFGIEELDEDMSLRNLLFSELNIKSKLAPKDVVKITFKNPKEWELLNYKKGIEGNSTQDSFYKAFESIIALSGHEINASARSALEVKEALKDIFEVLKINKAILDFDATLQGEAFQQQAFYQLWHLLYSYEGDNSKTGNEKLLAKLGEKFGFEEHYGRLLSQIVLQDGYGNLSTKAIKKILPYLKEGNNYAQACSLAGYRHSHWLTKEESENRVLLDTLPLLPKHSLRNPVVEKILNQMVNVVNAIIKKYGKPDEIRIELARELKKSAKERAEMDDAISKATKEHDRIKSEIRKLGLFPNGVRITRNNIIKYKLHEELAFNGFRTLYTNEYVSKEELFGPKIDIEHIIPQAVLFDDSFSNKTLSVRQINLDKGNKTAYDFLAERYGENSGEFDMYLQRVEKLFKDGQISRTKYRKLLMRGSEIPDGFIERDLRNAQYIAKKAHQMLSKVVKIVTPTSGSITNRLREDWQLINVMHELNWDIYNKLGLTAYEINKEGKQIPKILDWTKRNDHRHHAMDALTVAFTKQAFVQYFNFLNARKDENHILHSKIQAIEKKHTYVNSKNKRLIKPPVPIELFRSEAKRHIENILVSFKAKNKVVTQNKNSTKKKGGYNTKTELTPRGQLHKETVYGKSNYYKTSIEKIGPKFDAETIRRVANKSYREALQKRLEEFGNDPAKAFGGKNAPTKNPLYLDDNQSVKLPEKIALVNLEERYTIRKEVSPNLKIDKIVDKGTQAILQQRLDSFGGDKQKAFSNLDENPIWLNEEKGIQIKRVTITGVSNAKPLHFKKDHQGREILDATGKPIAVDFVSTGNNHHIGIYKDKEGKLTDYAVSFFEAVKRRQTGLPVVPVDTNDLWDRVLKLKIDDQDFLQTLPKENLSLHFSMKQHEYFVFPNNKTGFDPNKIDLMDAKNYGRISPNLFRVQKISKVDPYRDYVFRHHVETMVQRKSQEGKNVDEKPLQGIIYKQLKSLPELENAVKVRIDHLGEIVKIGE